MPPGRGSVPPFARCKSLHTFGEIFLMCLRPQPAGKKTSEAKKGAKFTFTLPIASEQQIKQYQQIKQADRLSDKRQHGIIRRSDVLGDEK